MHRRGGLYCLRPVGREGTGVEGVFVFLVESTFVVAMLIKFVAKFVVYDLEEISGGYAVGYGEVW
jgi:hypothetical protein